MNKNETVQLMQEIKTWYPRFEFPPDLLNAWYEKLKYKNYLDVKAALNSYIINDELGRTPTIGQLLKGRITSDGIYVDYEVRKKLIVRKFDEETYIDQEGRLWAYADF